MTQEEIYGVSAMKHKFLSLKKKEKEKKETAKSMKISCNFNR